MLTQPLTQVLLLLAAAVLVVALARRLGLPAILGYLVVGMLLGPSAFALLEDVPATRALAEIGVVFLLFTLGLEFSWPRMLAMRQTLHGVLSAKLPGRDFGYFLSQRGMFSYTGLSAAQVDRLREEFAVYLIRSGRLCVAGLNKGNVEATAQAMAAVM